VKGSQARFPIVFVRVGAIFRRALKSLTRDRTGGPRFPPDSLFVSGNVPAGECGARDIRTDIVKIVATTPSKTAAGAVGARFAAGMVLYPTHPRPECQSVRVGEACSRKRDHVDYLLSDAGW
jgi:hypothetical protein